METDLQAFYKGIEHLSRGNWAEGWALFENRPKFTQKNSDFLSIPEWKCEDLAGKSLLVFHEQGLGDLIQFSRFLNHPKLQNTRVVLAAPKFMRRLMLGLRVPEMESKIPKEFALDFDYRASVMSLPFNLGISQPQELTSGAYLNAEHALIQKWKERADAIAGTSLKVGLAWQGNKSYAQDVYRSFSFKCLEPLLKVPGIKFFSFQKGEGSEQLAKHPLGAQVVDWTAELDAQGDAFVDTAALMKSMDLIITSDTSICHLAGALGCPTWLMLGKFPDWRWQGWHGEESWYQSMRIFETREKEKWTQVFERVEKALQDFRRKAMSGSVSTQAGLEIKAPVSVGELVDKISILEIKEERIADAAKLKNVSREKSELLEIFDRELRVKGGAELAQKRQALKEVNLKLWVVEDLLRDKEALKDFGAEFVELARSVYILNDERARIKKDINLLVGSSLVEEKSYKKYQ